MRSRLALGAAMALLGGMVAGCGPDGNEDLDPYLCDSNIIGPEFQELVRGDFSPRDLADLGDDAGAREQSFLAAGMTRGRFVLFKQSLPKPPFDPPVNVVCEVLEFGSVQEAGAWVGSLRPDSSLEATLMGEVPPQSMTVAEYTTQTETILADGRRFLLSSDPGDSARNIALSISADGNRVRLLAVGIEGRWLEPPWDSWPEAWVAWLRAER